MRSTMLLCMQMLLNLSSTARESEICLSFTWCWWSRTAVASAERAELLLLDSEKARVTEAWKLHQQDKDGRSQACADHRSSINTAVLSARWEINTARESLVGKFSKFVGRIPRNDKQCQKPHSRVSGSFSYFCGFYSVRSPHFASAIYSLESCSHCRSFLWMSCSLVYDDDVSRIHHKRRGESDDRQRAVPRHVDSLEGDRCEKRFYWFPSTFEFI